MYRAADCSGAAAFFVELVTTTAADSDSARGSRSGYCRFGAEIAADKTRLPAACPLLRDERTSSDATQGPFLTHLRHWPTNFAAYAQPALPLDVIASARLESVQVGKPS